MGGTNLVRAWTPPALTAFVRRWRGRVLQYSGNPKDWAEALANSCGYATDDIVRRVAEATRAVLAGEARFERDSVLFDEPTYPFEILAALMRCAALNDGHLDVVDFGGSMGSTYRQCRPFMQGLHSIRWQVVEQPAFVEVARREFETDELSFRIDLPLPEELRRGALILASSVLQYLESPSEVLQSMKRCGATHLVIDRTTLSALPSDHLCIQHAPKHVYKASYPCWILSQSKLLEALAPDWRVLSEFPCAEGSFKTDGGVTFEFRGLIVESKRP